MDRYSLDRLEALVRDWAKTHGLDKGDPCKQLDRAMDELMELDEAIAKFQSFDALKVLRSADEQVSSQTKEALVELGDVLVAVFILAGRLDSSATECLNMAYDKIKDRTSERVHRDRPVDQPYTTLDAVARQGSHASVARPMLPPPLPK